MRGLILQYRRLRHGDPETKFKVLVEDINRARRMRRLERVTWALTVASIALLVFGWSSGLLPTW